MCDPPVPPDQPVEPALPGAVPEEGPFSGAVAEGDGAAFWHSCFGSAVGCAFATSVTGTAKRRVRARKSLLRMLGGFHVVRDFNRQRQ